MTKYKLLFRITDSTDLLCNGDTNGIAEVHPIGGVAPFTFLWNTTPPQSDSIATGLSVGTYSVTVTDTNGCFDSAIVNIDEPSVLTLTKDSTAASCNGICDGTATVTPSGGTTPYTYLWNDPGAQTNASANGLCAGTYLAIVTDNNGCTDSLSVTITEPDTLVSSTSNTNLLCNNVCNANATVFPVGGSTPYTFLWNDPSAQTNASATGLCAGTYLVVITDSNGCTATDSVVVTEPAALILTTDSVGILCNGNATGSAMVISNGGIIPYTYLWNDIGVQTTDTATGLVAGSYCVTVTDNNGCADSICVTIDQPLPIDPVLDTVSTTCGACNGIATSAPTGGVQPYSFNWFGIPSNNDSITGLCAGIYQLEITDANNCIDTFNVGISNIGAPVIGSIDSTQASCFGLCDGQATVHITPGTGSTPYTYLWNDPGAQTDSTATGLCAGVYQCEITDNISTIRGV